MWACRRSQLTTSSSNTGAACSEVVSPRAVVKNNHLVKNAGPSPATLPGRLLRYRKASTGPWPRAMFTDSESRPATASDKGAPLGFFWVVNTRAVRSVRAVVRQTVAPNHRNCECAGDVGRQQGVDQDCGSAAIDRGGEVIQGLAHPGHVTDPLSPLPNRIGKLALRGKWMLHPH